MLTGPPQRALRRLGLAAAAAASLCCVALPAFADPQPQSNVTATPSGRGTIVHNSNTWKEPASDTGQGGSSPSKPPAPGKGGATGQGSTSQKPTGPRDTMTAEELFYYFVYRIPECYEKVDRTPECTWTPPPPGEPGSPAQPAPPPAAIVREIAREVVLQLEIPSPEISIGPDPSVNEWNMAAVGYPLWLWTDTPASLSTTRMAYGLTFTLSATRQQTSFAMGDGNTVRCRTMSAYTNAIKPGVPSPTCGYVYEQPSLPKGTYARTPDGTYPITATASWNVTWTAAGHRGTLPIQVTARRDLPVGELYALLVAP